MITVKTGCAKKNKNRPLPVLAHRLEGLGEPSRSRAGPDPSRVGQLANPRKIHGARQESSRSTGGTPYAGATGCGHAAKARGRTHKQLNQTSQKLFLKNISPEVISYS